MRSKPLFDSPFFMFLLVILKESGRPHGPLYVNGHHRLPFVPFAREKESDSWERGTSYHWIYHYSLLLKIKGIYSFLWLLLNWKIRYCQGSGNLEYWSKLDQKGDTGNREVIIRNIFFANPAWCDREQSLWLDWFTSAFSKVQYCL